MKLYVEVEEDEFDRDIDRAFKTIAREVKLPGFRNGKAPRRVLEARIGIGPAREQALRESIPQYLAKAVREHDVDIISTPQIELIGVRVGERVRLPERHRRPFWPTVALPVTFRRSPVGAKAARPTRPTPRRSGSRTPPIDSPPCEEFG